MNANTRHTPDPRLGRANYWKKFVQLHSCYDNPSEKRQQRQRAEAIALAGKRRAWELAATTGRVE